MTTPWIDGPLVIYQRSLLASNLWRALDVRVPRMPKQMIWRSDISAGHRPQWLSALPKTAIAHERMQDDARRVLWRCTRAEIASRTVKEHAL